MKDLIAIIALCPGISIIITLLCEGGVRVADQILDGNYSSILQAIAACIITVIILPFVLLIRDKVNKLCESKEDESDDEEEEITDSKDLYIICKESDIPSNISKECLSDYINTDKRLTKLIKYRAFKGEINPPRYMNDIERYAMIDMVNAIHIINLYVANDKLYTVYACDDIDQFEDLNKNYKAVPRFLTLGEPQQFRLITVDLVPIDIDNEENK